MTIDEAKRTKLSKDFNLWEMLYSQTAQAYGYYMYQLAITPEQIANLTDICVNVLQPLRDYLKQPITINSGFRSEVMNKKIGGAKNSDHLRGMAVDFKCAEMDKAFEFIQSKCNFRQLINENDFSWIHVSYNEADNKKQTLKLP
jgi:zinc D-Ala-D-Ala carboxypeptidase